MPTWQTEIQKVKNGIATTFSNGRRAIDDIFSGISRKVVAEATSFFKNGTTVVGINVNQIGNMQTAIQDYVRGVNTALAELKNYDPKVAFRGTEIEGALVDYIDAVIQTCGAITSNMLEFCDKLDEVKAAYELKDQNSASAIKTSAENTRSAYTGYQGTYKV